jgi:hypothetical protein
MHVSQFNISKERYPLDHPEMRDFVESLATINALADEADGFVWRLKDESGNATAIRTYDDPSIIFNLSVWASVASLRSFAYRSDHSSMLRERRRWFVPMEVPSYVLWWVDADVRPSLDEAKNRLRFLQEHGASPYAFTFSSVPATASVNG